MKENEGLILNILAVNILEFEEMEHCRPLSVMLCRQCLWIVPQENLEEDGTKSQQATR